MNIAVLTSVLNCLQACGVALIVAGFSLYTDKSRILLSRLVAASSDKLTHLAQPFFYYIALVVAAAGMIAILASFVGWWAVCLHNYFILSIVRSSEIPANCGSILTHAFAVLSRGAVAAAGRVQCVSDDHSVAPLRRAGP